MTLRLRHPIVVALVASLMAIPGCGGSKGKPIPRSQATALITRLEEAKRRAQPFRCHDLQRDTIPSLQNELSSLPANTDSDIKQTLTDGIDHLNDLVSQQCNQQKVPTTNTNTTESTQTTTQSVPTTPPTTNTNTNTGTTNTSTNGNTNTSTTNTSTTNTDNGGTPGQGGQKKKGASG